MKEESRVEEKMEAITLFANRIKETLPKDFSAYSNSDYRVKNIIERNLQLISDAELDLLAILYKLKGTETIGREESLPEKLEGRISKRILEGFKRRRDFRNKLVHAYADLTLDKEAFEQASDTSDVEEFKKEARKAIG